MTSARPDNETIFHVAREISDPHGRREYVLAACDGDDGRLAHIVALLAAADAPDTLLDRPAFECPTATLDQAEHSGTIIGPYRLLEQIGEGGMGTVWMAQQTEPVKRVVALKLIKPGMDSKQVIARFEAERQALALMDHANIARVLDGGTTSAGRPFFVMDLVKGVPITKYCDANNLTTRQRLELFVAVCQAVQHAHLKGIIHRDLKPSNVLVALYDGKPVPKVIDFGVAKAAGPSLTDRTLVTGFGGIVGTLEYMSPEQAEFNQLDIDTRSDIYSLGVLLYELLTGTTPLTHKRLQEVPYGEILRIIKEEEPPRPSTKICKDKAATPMANGQWPMDNGQLHWITRIAHYPLAIIHWPLGVGSPPSSFQELDWIVMRCLEKDRNRRYESASALAADVQRCLNDEAVQACPPSAWYRFQKFARRKKALLLTASVTATALLVAVATLAISGAAVWQANQDLQRTLYFHSIALAHRELSVDNLHGGLKFLESCPAELRDWEWHYLMRLCRVEPKILKVESEVNAVAFSPEGDRIVSAGGDGFIKIWNSVTGEVMQSIPAHRGAVLSVAFHPHGRHVASRGADLKLHVWDLTAPNQAVFTAECDALRTFGTAYTIAFSADGKYLAAGIKPMVNIWDWKNQKLLHSLPGHNFHTIPVAFSSDGRLATGGFRDGPKLYDAKSGHLLRTVNAHDHPISALAFSADGKWVASASFGRIVKLSDSTSGRVHCTFDLHTGNVECVAIHRNGRRIASGGEDKTVRVWDAITGRELLGLHGHTERCSCVAFSPDGLRLVSASADKTIRIWDGTPLSGDEGRQEAFTFTKHTDELRSVAFSPEDHDVHRIASAGGDGIVRLWDAKTGLVNAEFLGHDMFNGRRAVVFSVAWHPKGHLIASSAVDTVRAWNARTAKNIFDLPATTEKFTLPYQALAFSPDGRYLCTGKVNGAVQVWDSENGAVIGTLDTHQQAVRGVAFSKDGEHLAVASSDGFVKLWDAQRLDALLLNEKREARRVLRTRVAGPGLSIAFSPDGRRLATAGERNTVKIWDVQTGQEEKTLWGHKGEVYTLAFSPDKEGRWIASAGEDSTVKIWNSDTGDLVRTFRGHRGIVSSLAFSPDGQRLVSGSRDHTVKVWDLTQLHKE